MAVFGVGTDIIEIERISDILSRGDRFLERVLTANEREYLRERGMKHESVASMWCAKEAVAKALGTGIRGFEMKDIEIIHDDLGKPAVLLHSGASETAERLGAGSILLSISHCRQYAVAMCVIEKREGAL